MNGHLLLTIPELAAELRVHRGTVYRLLQRGQLPIPMLKLGSKEVRVRRVDVEAYLATLAEGRRPAPALPPDWRRTRPG
jgi:excisionase family DNA binding protein